MTLFPCIIFYIILDFNLICVFGFYFKRTLTLFCILFPDVKNYIVVLIYIILIKPRFNFSCASYSALTLLFSCGSISSTAWLTISLFSCCQLKKYGRSIMPVFLSRPDFRILRTKVPQHLAFICWMPGSMNETSLSEYISFIVYITFSSLANTLTNIGVSIWQCGFSSHFPAVARTVGICPSRFLIRRFYYTFINICWYFHELKHVNSWSKNIISTIKSLHIRLLDPSVVDTV